jgi:hypothetical protein
VDVGHGRPIGARGISDSALRKRWAALGRPGGDYISWARSLLVPLGAGNKAQWYPPG